MRNGIYRVWVKGPEALSSGAVLLKDGDLVAANPTFGFVGRYALKAGRMTAEIACRRLSAIAAVNLPELDEFHLSLEGLAGREFASVTGTIAEVPGFSLPFDFAWLCEA